MAQRPEARLCQNIMKELHKIPNSYWTRVEQKAIGGTADIIGCFFGMFYWIEVKTEYSPRMEARDPRQLYNMRQVLEAGGAAMFMDKRDWKHQCQRLKRRAHQLLEKQTT